MCTFVWFYQWVSVPYHFSLSVFLCHVLNRRTKHVASDSVAVVSLVSL